MQDALEWLEVYENKSLEEIRGPTNKVKEVEDDPNEVPPNLVEGEVAKSLVCNDCGKKFRSVAQAEFHGAKTLDFPPFPGQFVHDIDMFV